LLSLFPSAEKAFNVESMGACQLKGKGNVVVLLSVEERETG